MCLTAHFVDNDWKLHKKILNFCTMTSHEGEAIRKEVENCLNEWGIVLTITPDNASSNSTVVACLKQCFQ